MSRNNLQAYYHIVFWVKRKEVVIKESLHYQLYGYIWERCEKMELIPMAVNGTENHIHILLKTHSNITIATIVQDIKGSSSRWLNVNADFSEPFSWQRGYGLFTVSPKDVEVIVNYIKKQKDHHSKGSVKTDWEML